MNAEHAKNDSLQISGSPDILVSATERMIQEISQMISAGKILPGSRFPSERLLATQYNVSRSTVREALHYFETLGMVKKVVGSGSYLVDDPDTLYRVIGSRQLIERYNWMEIIETRRVLELGIVQLAAQRATREDKLKLRKLCDETCKASTDASDNGRIAYTKLDYQLHREFACTARNSILLEMFEAIKDTFIESRVVWKYGDGNIDRGNESHRKIVEAIAAGDAHQAMVEMREHLDDMYAMALATKSRTKEVY